MLIARAKAKVSASAMAIGQAMAKIMAKAVARAIAEEVALISVASVAPIGAADRANRRGLLLNVVRLSRSRAARRSSGPEGNVKGPCGRRRVP